MSKKRSNRFKRFFLNGHLHRVIHTNRAANMVTAYDYVDEKIKVYPLSEVKANKKNAFTISETARLLDRHRNMIIRYINAGALLEVQREHDMNTKEPGIRFLSEDQVMELRDFVSTVHRGRPRKDGRITQNRLPSREELRTMVQSGRILYVKENDEFIPVWKANDW